MAVPRRSRIFKSSFRDLDLHEVGCVERVHLVLQPVYAPLVGVDLEQDVGLPDHGVLLDGPVLVVRLDRLVRVDLPQEGDHRLAFAHFGYRRKRRSVSLRDGGLDGDHPLLEFPDLGVYILQVHAPGAALDLAVLVKDDVHQGVDASGDAALLLESARERHFLLHSSTRRTRTPCEGLMRALWASPGGFNGADYTSSRDAAQCLGGKSRKNPRGTSAGLLGEGDGPLFALLRVERVKRLGAVVPDLQALDGQLLVQARREEPACRLGLVEALPAGDQAHDARDDRREERAELVPVHAVASRARRSGASVVPCFHARIIEGMKGQSFLIE